MASKKTAKKIGKTSSKPANTLTGVPASVETGAGTFFLIGSQYLVRTATNYTVGLLVGVNDQELLFDKAAWVVSTGRFYDSLKSGEFSEVEPFRDRVIVSRGAIVDATTFCGSLPLAQK